MLLVFKIKERNTVESKIHSSVNVVDSKVKSILGGAPYLIKGDFLIIEHHRLYEKNIFDEDLLYKVLHLLDEKMIEFYNYIPIIEKENFITNFYNKLSHLINGRVFTVDGEKCKGVVVITAQPHYYTNYKQVYIMRVIAYKFPIRKHDVVNAIMSVKGDEVVKIESTSMIYKGAMKVSKGNPFKDNKLHYENEVEDFILASLLLKSVMHSQKRDYSRTVKSLRPEWLFPLLTNRETVNIIDYMSDTRELPLSGNNITLSKSGWVVLNNRIKQNPYHKLTGFNFVKGELTELLNNPDYKSIMLRDLLLVPMYYTHYKNILNMKFWFEDSKSVLEEVKKEVPKILNKLSIIEKELRMLNRFARKFTDYKSIFQINYGYTGNVKPPLNPEVEVVSIVLNHMGKDYYYPILSRFKFGDKKLFVIDMIGVTLAQVYSNSVKRVPIYDVDNNIIEYFGKDSSKVYYLHDYQKEEKFVEKHLLYFPKKGGSWWEAVFVNNEGFEKCKISVKPKCGFILKSNDYILTYPSTFLKSEFVVWENILLSTKDENVGVILVNVSNAGVLKDNNNWIHLYC